MPKDFVEEIIAERAARNGDFPSLVQAAARRRVLLKELGEMRRLQGQSQTAVAAAMKSSQSSLARLEVSADDARLSTIDRLAGALGFQVQWHLVPIATAESEPPVVIHRA